MCNSMLYMKRHCRASGGIVATAAAGRKKKGGRPVGLPWLDRGFNGRQHSYPHKARNMYYPLRLYRGLMVFSDASPRDDEGFREGEDSGNFKPETAEASTIGQQIMSMLQSPGNQKGQDSVIQYLPDAVIDKYLEKYQNGAPGSMRKNRAELESNDDVCLQEFIKQSEEMLANSYTWRGLLFNAPKSVTMLSTLAVERNRVLQRFHLESFSGELMVINLELRLQKTLQATYRGLSVVEQWFLHGIKGEASADVEYPTCPTPAVGPERVVECQLNGLRYGSMCIIYNQSCVHSCKSVSIVFGKSVMFYVRTEIDPLLVYGLLPPQGINHIFNVIYKPSVRCCKARNTSRFWVWMTGKYLKVCN